ncbi:hypothetical protein [Mycoplasma suis]|uniref:Uncharacterized protein n=1 Tax=Mycoplasma suis (strain Illinois) TaxID=768700 RepID=F0QRS8_MYCSL|nr:hypothetical protein [Mycoplasma suis]ADX98198.1 hypothetical protein MSU_0667 [Mycoplasma suis str. Illinois]
MGALKTLTIAIISLASLGGGFELNRFLTDESDFEKGIEWESVWIVKDRNENICSISHSTEGVKSNIGSKGEVASDCFTSWAKNLKKSQEGDKTEWKVRARNDEFIKKMLASEAIYDGSVFEGGTVKPEGVINRVNDSQRQEKDSIDINLEFLKQKCEYKDEKEKNGWVFLNCPKNPTT